jgi:(p)ppGpp synthase/HD superfamily hydrolase
MNIVERAAGFAVKAHGEQKRKYTGEIYSVHLAGVARIVASVPHDPEMLAAAWLHDVVEDTSVTPQQLRTEFPSRVVAIVLELTDCDGSIGNRAFRKAHDRSRLASSSVAAKTIKLADLIDNTSSIVEHDKTFARVYLDEKALLLPCLKGGDATLWDRAYATLQDAQRQLVQAELGTGRV